VSYAGYQREVQDRPLPVQAMVLTSGVHGPTLGPIESLAINAFLVGIAFFLLCRPTVSPRREILVLSSITIAAAASRVLLEPIPNVQPLTVMCLVMGATLGARRGIAFAVMVTLLSNMVLSNGWWTLFQASGWAAVAFAGSRLPLIIDSTVQMKQLLFAAVGASLLFDWWVSLSIWTSGMSIGEFGLYLMNGLPFDALHILASLTAAVWLAPWLSNLLHEEVTFEHEPVATGEANVVTG